MSTFRPIVTRWSCRSLVALAVLSLAAAAHLSAVEDDVMVSTVVKRRLSRIGQKKLDYIENRLLVDDHDVLMLQSITAVERRLLAVEQAAVQAPAAPADTSGAVATGQQPTAPSQTPPEAPAPSVQQVEFSHAALEDKHEYVGPLICAPCHLPQYTSWQQTKMANAFEALKPGTSVEAKLKANLDPNKDYTEIAACVGCHVTGYGKKGGFVSIEATPQLAGVTCEACHGPAGTYMAKGLKKNPEFKKADLVANGFIDPVTVAQCQSCHNTNSPLVDRTYVFDFEANKEKGTHQHFPLRFQH